VSKRYPEVKTFRYYDAVGPENVTILELLRKFAAYQGNQDFTPVHIGYRNMERLLNVKSLGNMNRQFVSLLRSEQDSSAPIIGNPEVWNSLLGPTHKLTTLDEAFVPQSSQELQAKKNRPRRRFPYVNVLKLVWHNPRLILPGIGLTLEILTNLPFFKKKS